MLRRLFTLLSAVSLLLCGATVVLWMRSYGYADEWDVQLGRTNVHFSSFLGRTRLTASSYDDPHTESGVVWSPAHRETVGVWAKPRRLYVRIGGQNYLGRIWVRPLLRVDALHGVLVAATIVLPAACLAQRQWRRRRPFRGTLCRHCGYDVRATPRRCPECGAARELMPPEIGLRETNELPPPGAASTQTR